MGRRHKFRDVKKALTSTRRRTQRDRSFAFQFQKLLRASQLVGGGDGIRKGPGARCQRPDSAAFPARKPWALSTLKARSRAARNAGAMTPKLASAAHLQLIFFRPFGESVISIYTMRYDPTKKRRQAAYKGRQTAFIALLLTPRYCRSTMNPARSQHPP